jgi:hypothetical protein
MFERIRELWQKWYNKLVQRRSYVEIDDQIDDQIYNKPIIQKTL